MVNNYESTFEAVEMLIKKGYRKIAHITGPVHLNVFNDRQKGYIDALSKHKLGYQNHLIINKEFTIDDGKTGFVRILEQGEMPDAILSSSSLLSIGILLKAKELGYVIPDDLGLIGFGDNQISDILNPGITSIIQPEEEIASACYNIITKMINNENLISEPIIKTVKTKTIL